MSVEVNGDARDVPEGTTIQALLTLLNLADQPVAVECNGHIVPRAAHAGATLQQGDVIEIVHFVGGG